MKRSLLELIKNLFPLNCLMSIFDNDAHGIISKKGSIILNNNPHKSPSEFLEKRKTTL